MEAGNRGVGAGTSRYVGGFLRVLRFPQPVTFSSSSFHRCIITLAVAEALSPNNPNQTRRVTKGTREVGAGSGQRTPRSGDSH